MAYNGSGIMEKKGPKQVPDMLNNKVFNILHVITGLQVGGAETMLYKIVTSYDPDKFKVSICCISEGGEVADKLIENGYDVTILKRMKGHGFDLRAVSGLYHLIKSRNIHILRTHQYHPNLYGRIAGTLAGVPVIIPSFHNLYEFPDKPKFHRRIVNWLLSSHSDVLVAVSNAVASDIRRFDRVSAKKIKVMSDSIDTKGFNINISKREARRLLGLPDDQLIIGTVGRLDVQKGHRYLIEAASELNDVRLAIAGDGPLLGELQAYSDSLKEGVIFTGMLMPEKVPLFLRAIDIFCFPSLWEGFGIALAEAMAAGLPIVSSDILPLREVLGETGILVPPGDAVGLRKALKRLIDDASLRETYGQQAKERAVIFSIENYIKSFEDLCREVLKRKGLL
jgi:glycosyltransferase involved in cell wall biosynthesis